MEEEEEEELAWDCCWLVAAALVVRILGGDFEWDVDEDSLLEFDELEEEELLDDVHEDWEDEDEV